MSFHYLPVACTVVCTLQKPPAITQDTDTLLSQQSNNTKNHFTTRQLHQHGSNLKQQSTINDQHPGPTLKSISQQTKCVSAAKRLRQLRRWLWRLRVRRRLQHWLRWRLRWGRRLRHEQLPVRPDARRQHAALLRSPETASSDVLRPARGRPLRPEPVRSPATGLLRASRPRPCLVGEVHAP